MKLTSMGFTDYTNFLMKTKSKKDLIKIARSLSISPMPSRKLQIAELISEVSIDKQKQKKMFFKSSFEFVFQCSGCHRKIKKKDNCYYCP
jgi:rRNA maturation endonuclease Nob1